MVFKRLGRTPSPSSPTRPGRWRHPAPSTRQVDDDELVALAPRLGAVADLADLGVDVRLGHRAVGDRRPELPTLDVCFVKSETYFEALRMSVGNSCFVGWSEPEQMMVACGFSQLFSTRVVEPGVWV